jgi:hypothetical protein
MPSFFTLSPARREHFIWGVVLWVAYLWLQYQRGQKTLLHPVALVLAVPVVYLGTALPDWDIWLLGIGRHRNPIFHSAIPYFLLAWVWRKAGLEGGMQRLGGARVNMAWHIAFSIGLASHLLLDIWQYGDVRWITGRTLDRLWLGGHAVLLAFVVWFPRITLGWSTPKPRAS